MHICLKRKVQSTKKCTLNSPRKHSVWVPIREKMKKIQKIVPAHLWLRVPFIFFKTKSEQVHLA